MMNKLDGSDQSSSTSITSCISSSSVSFTSSEKVKQSTSQLIVQPGVTQNTVNSSVKSHSSPVVSQPSSSTLSSADILLNIEDFSSNLSSPLQQSTKTSSNTEETQLGDLKPSGQFMELQAIVRHNWTYTDFNILLVLYVLTDHCEFFCISAPCYQILFNRLCLWNMFHGAFSTTRSFENSPSDSKYQVRY